MFFPPNLGTAKALFIDSSSSLQDFPSLLLPNLERNHSQVSRGNMNGYSRIRKVNAAKSHSVDFAELSFTQQIHSKKEDRTMNGSIHEQEDDGGNGEVFGVVLSRRYPISSSNSDKVVAEQQRSCFHVVIKKSMSIKRSASVSEGYHRIHHLSDSIDSASKKIHTCKKKGKFLKTCRKFFGV